MALRGSIATLSACVARCIPARRCLSARTAEYTRVAQWTSPSGSRNNGVTSGVQFQAATNNRPSARSSPPPSPLPSATASTEPGRQGLPTRQRPSGLPRPPEPEPRAPGSPRPPSPHPPALPSAPGSPRSRRLQAPGLSRVPGFPRPPSLQPSGSARPRASEPPGPWPLPTPGLPAASPPIFPSHSGRPAVAEAASIAAARASRLRGASVRPSRRAANVRLPAAAAHDHLATVKAALGGGTRRRPSSSAAVSAATSTANRDGSANTATSSTGPNSSSRSTPSRCRSSRLRNPAAQSAAASPATAAGVLGPAPGRFATAAAAAGATRAPVSASLDCGMDTRTGGTPERGRLGTISASSPPLTFSRDSGCRAGSTAAASSTRTY